MATHFKLPKFAKLLLIAVSIAIVLSAGVVFFQSDYLDSARAVYANSATQSRVESIVKTGMKDPDSAQFRHALAWRDGADSVVWCGEVNAKNAFGGYVGFRRYVFTTNDNEVAIEKSNFLFGVLWSSYCQKAMGMCEQGSRVVSVEKSEITCF